MEVKNGQKIAIHLETQMTQQGQNEKFVLDVPGQLVKIGTTIYIRYAEIAETGEKIPVTVKIQPEGPVQIMRGKETHSRLKFLYETTLSMPYPTPYGVFTIESFTKNLHFSLKDKPFSGTLMLDYDLFLQNEKLGSYEMRLSFTA